MFNFKGLHISVLQQSLKINNFSDWAQYHTAWSQYFFLKITNISAKTKQNSKIF